MAPPDHERGDAPGRDTEGDAQSKITGQAIKGNPTIEANPLREVDSRSGAVMECVFAACVGRPVCPWAPWSCRLGGAA